MDLGSYFSSMLLFYYYFLSKREWLLGSIKRLAFSMVTGGKFLGWEDFSPELIKKFIVDLFGHVGFFSGNLVFS